MKKMDFKYLSLDEIDISISNVRKIKPKEEYIEKLANSIKEINVQQPVVVFKKDDRYELIIGQCRYLACKRLGLNMSSTTIPAGIAKMSAAMIANVISTLCSIINSFISSIFNPYPLGNTPPSPSW